MCACMPELVNNVRMPELVRNVCMPELVRNVCMPELVRNVCMPELVRNVCMPELVRMHARVSALACMHSLRTNSGMHAHCALTHACQS